MSVYNSSISSNKTLNLYVSNKYKCIVYVTICQKCVNNSITYTCKDEHLCYISSEMLTYTFIIKTNRDIQQYCVFYIINTYYYCLYNRTDVYFRFLYKPESQVWDDVITDVKFLVRFRLVVNILYL